MLLKDLRYAFRKLVSQPSFAIVIVITLGLCIGANTAIFSVVDAVLLRPLPYRDAERLVKIFESDTQHQRRFVSLHDFNEWRAQSKSFEDITSFSYVAFSVADPIPVEIRGRHVSQNFFQFLGVTPDLGRPFLPEDAEPGKADVAILSHEFWLSHFGADPGVVNRTITLNSKPHLIVGVLPASFKEAFASIPAKAQVWTPAVARTEEGTRSGPGGYSVIARLKPNITLEQAQAEMSTIANRLAQVNPKTNAGIGATVYWLHDEVTNSSRRSLVILFAAVGFVLLIACANIASLMLARSIDRSKEVAVRLAIGARRWHVMRQLFIESLLISIIGAVAGWFLATWTLRALVPMIPQNLPRVDEITLDYRSFVFTLGISTLAALLFGLYPAFHIARTSLTDALRDSGYTITEKFRTRRLRETLIAIQVALTAVLLVGAGLLTNSLIRIYRIDPGFDVKNLMTARLSLARTNKETASQWSLFWNSLLNASEHLPGTTMTALVNPLPLGGSKFNMNAELRADENKSGTITVSYSTVSHGYFRALGIPILQGRGFAAYDTSESQPVVTVNERFAQVYFPDQQVLGKSLIVHRGMSNEKLVTIVGVISDYRTNLAEHPEPQLYQSMSQFPVPSMYLLSRTTADETTHFSALRSAVWAINPTQALTGETTMERRWAEYTVRPRFYLSLLGGLSLLGLTMASVGIYGLLSHNVSQLTHEIGIRRALGARDGHLLRAVVGRGLALCLLGIAVGLTGAAFMSHLIREWLFEVQTTDPLTFVGVGFTVIFVALVACYFPARRATKIDPLVALRYE